MAWHLIGLMLCSGLAAAVPRPAAPSADLLPLIGEYGTGTGDSLLELYEDAGHLYAAGAAWPRRQLLRVDAGHWLARTPASAVEDRVIIEFTDDKHVAGVVIDGTRLPRRDVGREVVAEIRAGERDDALELRRAALQASPPIEPTAKRASDLVDLRRMDRRFKFDIRYATTNNFMGFALYDRPGAFLQRPAAEALRRAQQTLLTMGYGLLVFDAYRPWFVTKMFWDATPTAAHIFVADPSGGSRHNRGCAIDLTLYELRTGHAVDMTSRYDEMSRRSFPDYGGGSSRERWSRDLLRHAMEHEGFAVYAQEWWHFDYKDWRDYAIGNETFEQLQASVR